MTVVYTVPHTLKATYAPSLPGDAFIPPHPTPRHLAVPRAPPPLSTAGDFCHPIGSDRLVAFRGTAPEVPSTEQRS